METQPVVHNTFTVERNYTAAPERVFLAFSDPAKSAAGSPRASTTPSKPTTSTSATEAQSTTLRASTKVRRSRDWR